MLFVYSLYHSIFCLLVRSVFTLCCSRSSAGMMTRVLFIPTGMFMSYLFNNINFSYLAVAALLPSQLNLFLFYNYLLFYCLFYFVLSCAAVATPLA